MTESGEELKLVGGGEFFNGHENSGHLGKEKAVKVQKSAKPSANHLKLTF